MFIKQTLNVEYPNCGSSSFMSSVFLEKTLNDASLALKSTHVEQIACVANYTDKKT